MIITDEALLRVECSDVLPEEVGEIRAQLEYELKRSEELGRPGIGLAAPQIGIAKRFAIVRISNYSLDLINCKILHGYDPAIFRGEGCLSFPGRIENTIRFQEIHIVDNMFETGSVIITGLPAVCAQHELDHLNSILLPDVANEKRLSR